jgi:hypothetical protein
MDGRGFVCWRSVIFVGAAIDGLVFSLSSMVVLYMLLAILISAISLPTPHQFTFSEQCPCLLSVLLLRIIYFVCFDAINPMPY